MKVIAFPLAILFLAGIVSADWTPYQSWHGHMEDIETAEWSPDGTYLASGSQGQWPEHVIVWENGSIVKNYTTTTDMGGFQVLRFIPNSDLLAAASLDALLIWNMSNGSQTPMTVNPVLNFYNDFEISADGLKLANCIVNGAVYIYPIDENITDPIAEQTLNHRCIDIQYSPDGSMIASNSAILNNETGNGSDIRIWDAETYELLQVITHQYSNDTNDLVYQIEFSPDSTMIAASSSEEFMVFNVTDGSQISMFDFGLFSQDLDWKGDYLATATAVYDLSDPVNPGIMQQYTTQQVSEFSPNTQMLVLGSDEIAEVFGLDTDGDDVVDWEDLWPNDETQWQDSDGDGYGDNPNGTMGDQFPNEETQWNDTDNDGYGDNWGNASWNASRNLSWPGEFVESAFEQDGCPIEWGNSTTPMFGCPYPDGGSGNSTGNETGGGGNSTGNETGGNSTGNQTGGEGNSTGNETGGNSTGNETGGGGNTSGNETQDPPTNKTSDPPVENNTLQEAEKKRSGWNLPALDVGATLMAILLALFVVTKRKGSV